MKTEIMEMGKENEKPFGINDIISRLQSLTKYEATICGSCECCGTWVEHEADKYGNWINAKDIDKLVKELQDLK